MPWVRFFPSDWLGGTRGMSAAETGIYITLVATMYERGEPIPEDHSRLARLCGASNSTFKTALDALISEGKITRNEAGLWNERVEKESLYRAEKSEVGKQAADARWYPKGKKNNGDSHANALPTQSQGNANQKPDTIKKEKTLGASAPQTEFFAEFWIAYPRREGSNPRKPAKLIFDRLVARGVDPQRLIDAAKALAVEHPTPTRFIPQATTFLNQERFDDEAPLLTGNEFCAEDWPNTRILVARFKQEHQTDPPRAVNGGKAGYLIPAEWVAISKQQRAANA
jgi:uncharacterized protein YdaU (DUF1376 family)